MQLIDPELILESPRLQLEPLRPEHAEGVYKNVMDERIYHFIPKDAPPSLEDLENRYTVWASRLSPDGVEAWLNWVMRLRGSGAYVGTVQATVREDKTALMAYAVFPEHWRKGYASEGCQRILSHLFDDYRLAKVYADVDTRNLASIRLLEKLGFERIGFIKDADFFKDSTSDEYRYQLSSCHDT